MSPPALEPVTLRMWAMPPLAPPSIAVADPSGRSTTTLLVA